MGTEEEQIRQWRAQLAEEADSDDDGGFGLAPQGLGGNRGGPKSSWNNDGDLGLNLREPAPPRYHNDGASSPREPPRRRGQGPATGALLPPRGGAGAMPSGEAERELVWRHKLQVLQLKLEERELELETHLE